MVKKFLAVESSAGLPPKYSPPVFTFMDNEGERKYLRQYVNRRNFVALFSNTDDWLILRKKTIFRYILEKFNSCLSRRLRISMGRAKYTVLIGRRLTETSRADVRLNTTCLPNQTKILLEERLGNYISKTWKCGACRKWLMIPTQKIYG